MLYETYSLLDQSDKKSVCGYLSNWYHDMGGLEQAFHFLKLACHITLSSMNKVLWKCNGFYHQYRGNNAYYMNQRFLYQMNIRNDYKKQIVDHNVEKFRMIVRDDIDMFLTTKILMQANKNTVLQVNSVSDTKKIRDKLKWHIKKNK